MASGAVMLAESIAPESPLEPAPANTAPAIDPEPAPSNPQLILRWVSAQERPVLVREIIAGTQLQRQSVYNSLTDLVRSGRLVKSGDTMRHLYGIAGREYPQFLPAESVQSDTAKALGLAIDEASQLQGGVISTIEDMTQRRDALKIRLQFMVPIDKAGAVIRAIEQALV
jgi:hypothetical protein